MARGYRHIRVFASNRPKSEDAAEVFERGDTLVVVLADGAGGISGGAIASGALVSAVKSAVAEPHFPVHDIDRRADLFEITDETLAKNVGSDGLFKYAAMNIIAGVVRASPIGVAAERLIELVRLPSGKFADDVAVMLVSRDPVGHPAEASN